RGRGFFTLRANEMIGPTLSLRSRYTATAACTPCCSELGCQSQVGCRPDGRSFKISSASWPRSKAPPVPQTLRRGTGQSLEESLITRRSWTRSRNLPPKRMQLLRGYFEPSEQEREEGRKLPTAAHRAIAQLIAKGYVQVVVTTNFDQLLEQALVDVGIHPMVTSTPYPANGA